MNKKYTFFWDGPFSNWFYSPFEMDAVTFICVEQCMMWNKATMFGDFVTAHKILQTTSPREQKALGRGVANYDDAIWSAQRYDIVKDACRAKFWQHSALYGVLMDTKGTTLVEASPYDTIWGVGLYEHDPLIQDEANWKGLNLLGKVLTEVREEFSPS